MGLELQDNIGHTLHSVSYDSRHSNPEYSDIVAHKTW